MFDTEDDRTTGSDSETTPSGNEFTPADEANAETGNENVDTSVDPEVAEGRSGGEAVPASTDAPGESSDVE